MIKYNFSDVNVLDFDTSEVKKMYLNGKVIYQKLVQQSPTPPPPPVTVSYITYTASSKLNVDLTKFTPAATAETYDSTTQTGKIEFAAPLVEIGSQAFFRADVESIEMPDTVTTIDDSAFYFCSSLSSITLSNNLTSIGSGTFGFCTALETITIPDSVTDIWDGAFYCCSSLKNVILPNGITSIKPQTFVQCTALETIEIPNSVTTIGYNAFYNCGNFYTVTIPDSVTSIDWGAFQSCSLVSITIPSGVTNIGNSAFEGNNYMQKILCEGLIPPTIGRDVFDYTNNCSIYVDCSVIDDYKAATNWDAYEDRFVCTPVSSYFTFYAEENTTFSFRRATSTGNIQYSLDDGNTWTVGAAVTVNAGDDVKWKGNLVSDGGGIGTFYSNGRFSVSGNIMSLLFEDNFTGQTSLVGNSLAFTSLFKNCTSLTNVMDLALPATTLSEACYVQMFEYCTSITSLPSNLLPATTLTNGCYYQMFMGCSGLTALPSGLLPASTMVYQAYRSMFQDCTSLTAVPSDLLQARTLANYAYESMFRNCRALTNVPSLPATTLVNYCYSNMFNGCSSLTTAPTLLAPTLVHGCYQNMFSGCSNLNYIECLATDISATACTSNWVNGVATAGTFVRDSSMTSWEIDSVNGVPNGWSLIPPLAELKFTLTLNDSSVVTAACDSTSAIAQSEISTYSTTCVSAVIGNCVTSIGFSAFYNCHSLSSVTISSSVTRISNYAFQNCSSLTYIVIPSGVTNIGIDAFFNCRSLSSITVNATIPPTLGGSGVFNTNNNCPIYVPSESVDAYKSASVWSGYADRIQAIP